MLIPLVLLLAAPTPTPRPVATIAPKVIGETQSDTGLGAAAKKIKLNRSVSFEQATVPDAPLPTATPKPGAAPAASTATAPTAPTPAAPSDEQVWRDRKRKVDADVAAAEAALKGAESAVGPPQPVQDGSRVGVITNPDGSKTMGWVSDTANSDAAAIRAAALAPYRTRLAEAIAARDRLPEECRRTIGCQPGWVR